MIEIHEEPEIKESIFEANALKKILIMGVINFFLFILLIFSLDVCVMSTVYIIFRLSQFLATVIVKRKHENLKIEDYLYILISLGGFGMIIYSPSYYSFDSLNSRKSFDHSLGIIYIILACALLTYIQLSNDKEKLKHVDPQIFVSGVLSSSFGCITRISLNKDLYIGTWTWILLFLCTAFNYFSIYFKTKKVKTIIENRKLIPFSFIAVIATLLYGLIFFGQSISLIYSSAVIITIINVILYSRSQTDMEAIDRNENDDF